jgi:hypothetical protein
LSQVGFFRQIGGLSRSRPIRRKQGLIHTQGNPFEGVALIIPTAESKIHLRRGIRDRQRKKTVVNTPGPELRENAQAFCLLWEAWQYARELGCELWEFAVELPVLQSAGLTINELRWLVMKGYAEHGRDVTAKGDVRRKFRRGGPLLHHSRTCMVLTDEGCRWLRGLAEDRWNGAHASPATSKCLCGTSQTAACEPSEQAPKAIPKWDRDRQELSFGEATVKRYRLPSPNQETVLMAFEEESWPPRIDDPLPVRPGSDAKQRLHDTIKGLNRHQVHRRIRFMGDGSGTGIRWEPIAP